jgi:exodeoxyribonuclease VII large subunit
MLVRQHFAALSTGQIQNRLQTLIGRRAQRLDHLHHRIEVTANRRLRTPVAQLAALAVRLERLHPAVRLALVGRRLDAAHQSLSRLAAGAIAARATRLDRATARLGALSPLAVLNRGYALVYNSSGQLLHSSVGTNPGSTIRARLAKGALEAEVTKTEP